LSLLKYLWLFTSGQGVGAANPQQKREALMATGPAFRILVVDHDEDVVKATTSMLERLGYVVQGEQESLKALRAFSEDPGRFDLAIIEPTMPGLMGVDLAANFRHIRRGFPVMLYSGNVTPFLEVKIEAAGLGPPILKPLSLHELKAAVKSTLGRVRA
jgi:DNA-binding response OmpR family regulator